MMSSRKYYWKLTWGSVVKFLILTLARISLRNIYLNLFGGAYFHWRSLKACNIATRTSLNYVWTAIFPWSHCSLKLQILRLFRAGSSKTVKSRFSVRKDVLGNFTKFTGKHVYQWFFFKKETLGQVPSCEFCKISKKCSFTEHLLTTASYVQVT